MSLATGTFGATGQSTAVPGNELLTLSLSGFDSATVILQRSFDKGSTWKTVKSYTADAEENIETVNYRTLYRLNCTVWSSGTITYWLGV